MNIFVLHDEPRLAAQAHLDRHVVKMILEYAQLLSTAHRILDGTAQTLTYEVPQYKEETLSDGSTKYTLIDEKRKTKKAIVLPGETAYIQEILYPFKEGPPVPKFSLEYKNRKCYNHSHVNHPCAVWAREVSANYLWLYELFKETAAEYTFRYGKEHKTWRENRMFLATLPKNIRDGRSTPFPQAMPEEFKNENAVLAYQNYYVGPKSRMARWTRREVPTFFKNRIKNYNESTYARSYHLA